MANTAEQEMITVTLPDDAWKAVQLAISYKLSHYYANDWGGKAGLLEYAQNAIDDAACELPVPAVVVADSLADCGG
jgi:hypothetical protein